MAQSSPSQSPSKFQPYIPAGAQLPEFTFRSVLVGTLLGIVFGASSLYLVLKVGLTVSASIPVAVISLTFFKLLKRFGFKDASILENNIAQTAGSAGESIAFGVGVTMPAILILGFDLEIGRVMLVSILGGLLGILMMIPLRRALIDKQHGILKYPEGTACAEVLKAGASDESREAAGLAKDDKAQGLSAGAITAGFGIGLVYKLCMSLFTLWKESPGKVFGAPLKGGSVGIDVAPELLGVGYIIGLRIGAVMCAGGVLAYLVLIPLIQFFGEGLTTVLSPGQKLISEMDPDEIRGAYILYIGAGAVAAGGIISLVRSLPLLWSGLKSGLADLRGTGGGTGARTDRDLPIGFVLIGILTLMAAILLAPTLHMNLLGAILIVVFGFVFVTVSSRLTGEIGSSSNPISGMTVATLLLTCLAFLAIGWTGNAYYVTALSVGAVVCIAASNGGTTSQDLKTGFLVGGTPRLQQMAILIGAGASAIVLGPILLALNESGTVYVPQTALVMKEDGTTSKEEAFKAGLAVDLTTIPEVREKLVGPDSGRDSGTYRVWFKADDVGGPAGKYLVDDAGKAVYLSDPGINGNHTLRADGSEVTKFSAPKATLMSYIIKGILNQELPWALVLLGVMIALVLELAGVPSLAFAVGVYLPLSASTPILVGGLVRHLVDRRTARNLVAAGRPAPTDEELAAEGDKSPGVLLSSGYIAGSALAGIGIAIAAGFFLNGMNAMQAWSAEHSPAMTGEWAQILSLIPFALITALLVRVGLKGARQAA
ncbi:MAG: oligopeptide transporter, OPT family [Myxococcales bacterium]|nr:oligopeptide transporter, OPT family [Myxococcales bacterium]